MTTPAEQLHNPGCVKNARGNPWQGSEGSDDRGHARFVHPSFGCRAVIRTLASKYLNGKQSIKKIIEDWAPASDTQGSIPGNPPNNPVAYADAVAKWLDRRPEQDLYLFKPDGAVESLDMLIELARCIEQYEAGYRWVDMSAWHAGLSMYYRDFVEK